jgi:precorrin-6B methylase 2
MENPQNPASDSGIRSLIRAHEADNVAQLALKWSGRTDIPVNWVLTQIGCRQIARSKLPSWFALEDIVYPDKTALEQCSSETAAVYKQPFSREIRVADLTGGLGVDTWSFAQNASAVLYCEPDTSRFETAKNNFGVFGLRNVEFVNQKAEDVLEDLKTFRPDLIYLDPSRRKNGIRFFRINDLQPDIGLLLPELLKISDRILMKAAPMLDIKLAIRELQHVQEVHVLSVRNECRELLFYMSDQKHDDPLIRCVEFQGGRDWDFEFRFSEEEQLTLKTGALSNYLLDPFACVTKAGGYKSLTKEYDVKMVHANTHLYTALEKPKGFPGRCFKIETVLPYDAGLIRETITGHQGHLVFRNFPVKPEVVEKKLRFTSGGEIYLFFLTDHHEHKRVALARAIN